MRRTVIPVVLACVLAAATAALAQDGPGGPGGPGRPGARGGRMGGQMMGGRMGGLQLLSVPEVQTELKMTQPQIEKLQPKSEEVQTAMREMMRNAGNMQQMTAADRQKLIVKMLAIQTKAVTDILDTEQYKRYHQIELQVAGPAAFSRADVAGALKITEEQATSLREIQTKAMAAMQASRQNVDFRNMTDEQRQEQQKAMAAARKQQMADSLAVLTEAQQKQWKAMLGKEFKMPTQRMRPNRNQPQPAP